MMENNRAIALDHVQFVVDLLVLVSRAQKN
jgi:hypothetical protein